MPCENKFEFFGGIYAKGYFFIKMCHKTIALKYGQYYMDRKFEKMNQLKFNRKIEADW